MQTDLRHFQQRINTGRHVSHIAQQNLRAPLSGLRARGEQDKKSERLTISNTSRSSCGKMLTSVYKLLHQLVCRN